ncbi:response regulator [Christensenellaceae bacterium NSJ-44]|uniref:Circadian input-output histidine kinase CikA n=1 Tax=Luoshenia tenuis TaxID=2763654 RepID=A0A926HJC2_9FIRM|nr:response regulator [Luoshenia tenuis]MBC8529742.1 response regulator [Luoshenia tenuis]
MRNKISHFLIISLLASALLCIGVFSSLLIYMNHKQEETIEAVSGIYMSGMNRQIIKQFGLIFDNYMEAVEQIDESITPDMDEAQIYQTLAATGQTQGFEALAFCSAEGKMEKIYGELFASLDPEPFLASLERGDKRISTGADASGNKKVLIGVPLRDSVAEKLGHISLIAAVPVDNISDALNLYSEDMLIYSFVIRRDGSFVIRSYDAYRESYFERIRSEYQRLDGKDAEQYVEELASAMRNGEDYSAVFLAKQGDKRQLQCTVLPYSEWYLITVMPYGPLNGQVEQMSSQWLLATIGSCAVILLALLLIFMRYMQLNRMQLKELEDARHLAEQASRSKSEFLSNMSHDIRTPMNAIVGMTAIATANIDDTQKVRNCLKKITLSSRHLLGLINDVLDMSKIESGKMTLSMDRLSLREMMEGIVSIVQPQVHAKKQQFDISIYDITAETVCADGVRLNQVMLNLLSNAIKFTPEGGTIHVSMYEESSPVGEDHIRVHLRVKDNGIGMTKEFQEKLYEVFVREDNDRIKRTEGSGLGMAITKYIVDAMKGSIEVESQPGVGTEFHVTLDLQKSAEREEEMILPEWHMLVVDDDQQMCQSAAASLQSIGVRADWTLDGESAVELVCARHEARQDYDIILLDWKLPGMDGIDTAREIRRQLNEDIPILLISAYDWSEIEQEARAAGISGFISKPLFRSTLYYGLKAYANLPDEQAPEGEAPIELAGRRILVAEDNELNWEIAQDLLEDVGLELEWAENGKICVDKFAGAPVGRYDAILMDIRMPEMNGYEAAQAIRSLERPDAGIPIIAMTADAFVEDIQKCMQYGMNAHIAKPIDIDEVLGLLKKFIQ